VNGQQSNGEHRPERGERQPEIWESVNDSVMVILTLLLTTGGIQKQDVIFSTNMWFLAGNNWWYVGVGSQCVA